MRFLKRILLAAVGALLLAQCGTTDKAPFTVSVTYKNADKLPGKDSAGSVKILLEEIPYGSDRPVILDTVTLTEANGKVTLKGNGKEEGVYELMIEDGPVVLLVNDEAHIDVTIDLSKKDNYYTVTGSSASNQLKKFIEDYSDKSIPANRAFAELDSLKQYMAEDSLILVATEKKNDYVKALNDYLEKFITDCSDPAVSMFALGMSSRSLQRDSFEDMLNKVVKKFPDHKTLASLKATYEAQKEQIAAEEKKARERETSWVGKPAPDLEMLSINGQPLSIASFKGKYVLVDFWASWCGPCRQENPSVVRAYQQFKDKNFTVLGVSLDKNKEAWEKAIKDDKLDWPQMSDLKYWDSKAVEVYGFQGIPYNVLIDPQGIVIAEGLRGFDLEKKLSEVLK